MQCLHIFAYDSPVVTLKEGNAWVTNGYFKLVHVIDLAKYDILLRNTEQLVTRYVKDEGSRSVIGYHLEQIRARLTELKDAKMRRTRSINWIGSAWKWIGGSPDASDWDKLLERQTDIEENNNRQYTINKRLFDATQEVADKLNKAIEGYNNSIQRQETDKVRQDLLNKVLILKEGVNEIIRACQMAKNGIVNSNLLDLGEINIVINELETLPYQNVVEAIEYGQPSIYCNGTLMLYILSLPKINPKTYHLVTARATIRKSRQIDLEFQKLLVSHDETYGLNGHCLNIGNNSVCREDVLKKLKEDSCLPRMLKGGDALCDYKTNTDEIIEQIGENTIFLTNFNGTLLNRNLSIPLEGTYLIQMSNETIRVKNKVYSSGTMISPQALPPVLTNVTSRRTIANLEFVHRLSAENIDKINFLHKTLNSSIFTEIAIILVTIGAICLLWKKIYVKANIPQLRLSFRSRAVPELRPIPRVNAPSGNGSRCPHTEGSDSMVDLRDADI